MPRTCHKQPLLGCLCLCCIAMASSSAWAADCNDNGIEDQVDVAGGTSADCNGNLVPDECDMDDGSRIFERVGNGYTTSGNVPPPHGAGFKAIAGGSFFGLALRLDGTIRGWGRTNYGLSTPPSGSGFVAIDGGSNHAIALHSSGYLIGWGYNGQGQISVPSGSNYIAIAAGAAHNLAIRNDHSIVGWGDNTYGQRTPPPGNDFTAVSAGLAFSLALKADGSIVGWGYNQYGQAAPPGGNDYVAIAAGGSHGVAIKADGTIVCWGRNDLGQATAPAGNDFIAISAGYDHNLALRRDGSLVAWGSNSYGMSTPPSGTGYAAVAAGDYESIFLKKPVPLSGDCNINGVLDACDIADGTSSDCNTNHIPDTCESLMVGQELGLADAQTMDYFGHALALDGDRLLVGVPQLDSARPGKAVIYRRSSGVWSEEQRLIGNNAYQYASFGSSVALDQNTALIGAPYDSDRASWAGAAHVFVLSGSTWTQQAKLTLDIGAASDRFGGSVSLRGSIGLVGAAFRDDNGADSGAAYLFRRDGTTWTRIQRLTPSDAAATQLFGSAVHLSDDLLIVGATSHSELGSNAGAAYVFRRNGSTWEQEARLLASDGSVSDRFGSKVWIGGDLAAVSAPYAGETGSESGAVYLFRHTGGGWSQEAKLVPHDPGNAEHFGASLGVFNDVIAVGAPEDTEAGPLAGALYLYHFSGTTWNETRKIPPPYTRAYSHFASSLAVEGSILAASCPASETTAWYAGFVNLLSANDADTDDVPDDCEDCDGNGADDATEIAANPAVDCNGNGILDACESEPTVTKLAPAPGQPNGYFGTAVAADGDVAVVAALNEGKAHVLRWTGANWARESQLVPWGTSGTVYCVAVAIQNDTAVVGARWYPSGQPRAHAAFVFRRSGTQWVPAAQLRPWDLDASEAFAEAIAIEGELIVVSAALWDDNPNSTGTGAAYVYRKNGDSWLAEIRLEPPGPSMYRTGQRVAASGDVVILSAAQASYNSVASGIAHVYRWDGAAWNHEAVLAPGDPNSLDFFGMDVAVKGNTAVIGAWQDDEAGSNAGAAYVFDFDGSAWLQTAKLMDPSAVDWDQLGAAVAYDGRTIVVGATGTTILASRRGGLYLFHKAGSTWTLDARLTPAGESLSLGLGYNVAISGPIAVAGAYYDDQIAQDAGAAYSLHLPDADHDGVSKECDLCPETPADRTVGQDGCALPASDFDQDGDVDVDDFDVLEPCMSGSGIEPGPGCQRPDLDDDGDIDQSDFGIFQRCISGQDQPALADCGD